MLSIEKDGIDKFHKDKIKNEICPSTTRFEFYFNHATPL